MRLSFNAIEFSTSSRLMAGSCAIDIIQLGQRKCIGTK